MQIQTLAPSEVPAITGAVSRAAREHGLSNIFNPSIAVTPTQTFVTLRASSFPGEKPFRAYLLRLDKDGGDELVDLTAEMGSANLVRTADPKLVRLGDDVYVTFNTGKVHEAQNDIYLQRVTPTLGPLQRCLYPKRRAIEKNWGFYLLPDGVLRAIYTIAPLTVLSLVDGELGVTETLAFEETVTGEIPTEFPKMHIGTQPLLAEGGRALVVANEQRFIPVIRRKFYFGRLVELDLTTATVLRISERGLIHSWRSMLMPELKPHNPSLWSATYFSGIARDGDDLILGYGVDDRTLGVARLPEQKLWP